MGTQTGGNVWNPCHLEHSREIFPPRLPISTREQIKPNSDYQSPNLPERESLVYNIPMQNESLVYIIAIITSAFILLGLAGFMYDRITKGIPKEDEDMSLRAPNRKITAVFNAPFKYIHSNLKEKNYAALIPFTLYLLNEIYIILLLIKLTKLQ